MKTLITALIALLSISAKSQRLFQDAAGESNIFLSKSPFGFVFFNTSDKSASLGYNYTRRAGYDFEKWKASYIYGGDIKVGVKEGLGSIIAKGDIKPGISLNANFGITKLVNNANFLNLFIRPGFSYTEFTYISNVSNLPEVKDLKKKLGSFLINLNYQLNGAGKKFDELTQRRIIDSTKHFNLLLSVQTGY